ncbi:MULTISPECIES: helix-turn-helix domain-containing protein [Proteus]|uniref:helix-turn-helix domain-containing protein n=1 Tax=Proteus TaxID=583 RepID=UPI000B177287|nr:MULTISPECIES: helix-turn-helix transcriptional regulator [Proteus]ELT0936911.1 helix-turn-helix transcriptional regulator [Proteus mirabilis]MBG2762173.1 helix-turn-helix transcriptional regulator [Proteus mirabilis]MBG2833610.1 helix-turn-helix transcriptional regulator [Proteus mirabilis]MBG3104792.1 helix-turn-helix transcriptional regulator [Proteus mirabilis]MBG5944548.1 helix-turn-helix transcriptional regulator [Proteus mirabilis]
MNTLNYIISKKIKQKRKELKLTGIQMGYLLGISQQHFSRLENGHIKFTVEHIFAIASILEVKPESLLPTHNIAKAEAISWTKTVLSAETTLR